ncbi:MAG: prephenate dehydratase [Flavobacteriaceae bacterium]|nr:prephenate dehydratase [Flavobacteriaceae bacterium]
MKTGTIAIQGIKGSNHYKVVRDYFGENTPILACNQFKEVAQAVNQNKVTYGLMAIENSIAGSILPNYQIIIDHNLCIVQEFYLTIAHHLVALPNQNLSDIQQVKSHQMALYQCSDFFSQHPGIQLIDDVDTALPAKIIAEEKIKNTGALVPEGTAELFGLSLIQSNLQNQEFNETRFVLLQKKHKEISVEDNKATLNFTLAHEEGSLAKVLLSMSLAKMNLTKIQSIPDPDTSWAYAFIVDVRLNKLTDFKQLLKKMNQETTNLRVLGTYKSGRK